MVRSGEQARGSVREHAFCQCGWNVGRDVYAELWPLCAYCCLFAVRSKLHWWWVVEWDGLAGEHKSGIALKLSSHTLLSYRKHKI